MNLNGLINKHVAQLLFYLCLYERLVTFTSLKICLNCTMVLYQLYSWDKVETKSTLFLWANCGKYKLLWVLLIDNILVYKLMKCLVACHGNSLLFSIYFCVKNQDAKSFSTVLSLPF